MVEDAGTEEARNAAIRAEIMSRENLQTLLSLIHPHIDLNGKTLAYILAQTNRIGHFITEMQIIETLYRPHYDRIVIVSLPMSLPGTNPWVRNCFDEAYRFVETVDETINAMGLLIDGGVGKIGPVDLLLQTPQRLHIEFFRSIVAGQTPAKLAVDDEITKRAETLLAEQGVDKDRPMVLLHIRTMQYKENLTHNQHRTTDPLAYRDSVNWLLDEGYQVIRIGETGIEFDVNSATYFDSTGWADRGGFLDLYLAQHSRFGLMQDSGPVWMMGAFGRQAFRTNCPYIFLNYNFLDDPNLYKLYRHKCSQDFMTYREAMEAELPLCTKQEDFDAKGVEMTNHEPGHLLEALREMVSVNEGRTTPSETHRKKLYEIGASLENRMRDRPEWGGRGWDFYGMAHDKGWVPSVMEEIVPGYFD